MDRIVRHVEPRHQHYLAKLQDICPVPIEFDKSKFGASYVINGSNEPVQIKIGPQCLISSAMLISSIAHEVGHAMHHRNCKVCRVEIDRVAGGDDDNPSSELLELHAHEFVADFFKDEPEILAAYIEDVATHCNEPDNGHYTAIRKFAEQYEGACV